MAALLRTAAALAPPPSSPLSAREPRGRCLRFACFRRTPARPLRAWLLPTPHVFCRDGGRFRRLAATEADEAAQTATQIPPEQFRVGEGEPPPSWDLVPTPEVVLMLGFLKENSDVSRSHCKRLG